MSTVDLDERRLRLDRGAGTARSLVGPVRLGGRTAPSRVLFGPHETNLGRRREISDRHVAYYARRAAGGAGVIVTEIASVHDSDWPYERAPLATDAAPGWREVGRACRGRGHGALVLAGLGHAGAQGSSAYGQPLAAASSSAIPVAGLRDQPARRTRGRAAARTDGTRPAGARRRRRAGRPAGRGNGRPARTPGGALRAGAADRRAGTDRGGRPGRAEFGHLVRDLLAEAVASGVEIRTGCEVDVDYVQAQRPDVVVLATGARSGLPLWRSSSCGNGGVVGVREVLSGTASMAGSVLVYDELGFHEATSVAELLAAHGCAVEIMTPGMVVGQDLGITLDMELFHRRADAAGIMMSTDRVITGAAPDGAGVRVSVLHHTVGITCEQRYDRVVCAVPGVPEDGLWQTLRGTGRPVHRVGDCLAPRRVHSAVVEGHRVGVRL